MNPEPWRAVDCFSGPGCWCACLVNPAGREVIPYGSVSRESALAIVDALNGFPAAHREVFDEYPLPWVAQGSDGGPYAIMTARGAGTDSLEECVCVAVLTGEDARMIVEGVNGAYTGEDRS